MAEIFTLDENGWRKLLDAFRAQQREVSNLRRHLQHVQESPTAYPPPSPWFFGVTHADFEAGTDDFLTVGVLEPNSEGVWEATGTVHDDVINFHLNDGDTIARGTTVEVRRKKGQWVLSVAYCDVSTNADIIATLPEE